MFVMEAGNARVADGVAVTIAGRVLGHALGVVHAGLGVDDLIGAHQLIE